MSDDALIEKFARELCLRAGHHPDTEVVEYPMVPYHIKGRRYAFQSDLHPAVPIWKFYAPEARIMAAVVRGEAVT